MDMYFKKPFDMRSFEFWSGAADRMNNATEEQVARVEERLKECFFYDDSEIPTETQINDFVWFECDDIFFPETETEDDDL